MTYHAVGADLLRLVASAKSHALLAAPFMKAGTVARLLAILPDGVSLRCYTRWRPQEIAAGVSDLEVADLIADRPYSEIFLVGDLHAKLYCADENCLVTSANLTGSALGWRSPANIELAIEVSREHPAVVRLEQSLARYGVPVTPQIRAAIAAAVSEMPAQPLSDKMLGQVGDAGEPGKPFGSWMPSSLIPTELYALYQGRDQHVSREAGGDAYRDLDVLDLPSGLSRAAFHQSVRSILLQHPILSRLIASATSHVVTEESAEEYFAEFLDDYLESSSEAFRISARWIAHFFSDNLHLGHEGGRDFLGPGNRTPR